VVGIFFKYLRPVSFIDLKIFQAADILSLKKKSFILEDFLKSRADAAVLALFANNNEKCSENGFSLVN